MITTRLKTIFALSIPLFIAHGVEEFLTHFYDIDAHDQAIFGILSGLSNHGATFVVFQVMLWLLLTISLLLLLGPKWQFNVLALVGLIYLYELHHIYKAIMIGGYYPGLITSLAFPSFTFFFWKEWFTHRKAL
ncbi:MAG: HXXEE domain-containing protein [Minisyncoccota bacterium]